MSGAASLFFKQILKIHAEQVTDKEKIMQLYDWQTKVFIHLTKDENLHFTTLFSRISYVCHKYPVSRTVQWHIHTLRRRVLDFMQKRAEPQPNDYLKALQTLAETISEVFGMPIPDEVKAILPTENLFETPVHDVVSSKPRARVFVVDHEKENNFLLCRDEENPTEIVRVKYNHPALNETFEPTIQQVFGAWGGKVTLNLLEVEIDSNGVYYPRQFIIEPDYLVDISSIAECFQGYGAEPMLYLLKKFLPYENTVPLMTGNVANFLLDELMSNPQVEYKEIFPKAFRINPLAFSLFEDAQVREIYQNGQKHFVNLRALLAVNFGERGIEREHCFLEPSFYSERYGIQGRLDVLFRPPSNDRSAIIELKSGKPFAANRFGISNTHYTQTLLYDLLIRSVYGDAVNPETFILYSGLDMDQLKFAPPTVSQQLEALQVRNQMVAIERHLCRLDELDLMKPGILDRIKPEHFPGLVGFTKNDVAGFAAMMEKLKPLERKYFLAFVSFTAREHLLAKAGDQANESPGGLASLWRETVAEKEENFAILAGLELEESRTGEDEPLLCFKRDPARTALANFREGDIAVLYPAEKEEDNALHSQIFKGNIIEMTPERVTVKLRYKQFNNAVFEKGGHWNLEHDLMDSSYNGQYKGLYSFLDAQPRARALLLTTAAPAAPTQEALENVRLPEDSGLTEEQCRVLKKALTAPDYFLLVGPPGTGKTKYMLRYFVDYIVKNTDENLLLLAYTNRAVDEICDAIHDIAEEHYLRLGTGTGADKKFAERLFQKHIAQVSSRKELREVVDRTRVFVATVAGMQNNMDLLKLKKFERVVIDEASQILEPMIVGLLPHFQRFVLIGDHKQLPAVVQQAKERSAVNDPELLAIGLHNRRNSLFERLYRRAEAEQWDWACDMLSVQGRMHRDLCLFPNEFFYENKLRLLPTERQPGLWQTCALDWLLPEEATPLETRLAYRRMHFFETPPDSHGTYKTNAYEARLVAELIESYRRLYEANGLEWTAETVGVITPFRAQIALIKSELSKIDDSMPECTVDTVERYQGGARDIIIISLCINTPFQLDSLQSLADDGVTDRKLNVALTRARRHLVVVGHAANLRGSAAYVGLLEVLG